MLILDCTGLKIPALLQIFQVDGFPRLPSGLQVFDQQWAWYNITHRETTTTTTAVTHICTYKPDSKMAVLCLGINFYRQGSYKNLTVVFQDKINSFTRLFKAFCSSLCKQKHYKIGFKMLKFPIQCILLF